MLKSEAENLSIEEVENLSFQQAQDYIAALNNGMIVDYKKAGDILENDYEGLLPGLLERIALKIIHEYEM